MGTERGPYWGIAETLTWIVYDDSRAVDLITEMVELASVGRSDCSQETLYLLELLKGQRGENGRALFPLIEYDDAVGLLVRACRQQSVVAEARGVQKDKDGQPFPFGPWAKVPAEDWHDGKLYWLDSESHHGFKRTMAYLFVRGGPVRAALRFPQSEIKAVWPANDRARMPDTANEASSNGHRGSHMASPSDGPPSQPADIQVDRPARVGRPRGTGKQKDDEEIVSALVELIAGGMLRGPAISKLVDEGRLPDDEATRRRMYKRLQRRLGPANAEK